MKEVFPNLHLGADEDFGFAMESGYTIVSAAKEPHHRDALGYTTRGAPEEHPERYCVQRGDHLILNWVDVDDPRFFRKEELFRAGDFISRALINDTPVLVHCNKGLSRSPALVLWWLHKWAKGWENESPETALAALEHVLGYHAEPRNGIWGFVKENWNGARLDD